MSEQELLLDCVRRLNRTGTAYMLTGSMASNAWGIPRTTHDLDFVLQLPPSQIPALVAAFASPRRSGRSRGLPTAPSIQPHSPALGFKG